MLVNGPISQVLWLPKSCVATKTARRRCSGVVEEDDDVPTLRPQRQWYVLAGAHYNLRIFQHSICHGCSESLLILALLRAHMVTERRRSVSHHDDVNPLTCSATRASTQHLPMKSSSRCFRTNLYCQMWLMCQKHRNFWSKSTVEKQPRHSYARIASLFFHRSTQWIRSSACFLWGVSFCRTLVRWNFHNKKSTKECVIFVKVRLFFASELFAHTDVVICCAVFSLNVCSSWCCYNCILVECFSYSISYYSSTFLGTPFFVRWNAPLVSLTMDSLALCCKNLAEESPTELLLTSISLI